MLTRMIYPLYLRERISWRVHKFYPKVNCQNINLEFNKYLKLDLSKYDVGHKSIIFNGFYEIGLTRDIIKIGKSGGLLVDVGANYGYFSCLWASQNANNKVIAFEASPLNVEPLRNNVNKNNLTGKISIIPNAVGKEKGKLKFNLKNESQQTGWGALTLDNNLTAVEVEVDTLDNYLSGHNVDNIEVLKIDTEGADTWVLYGAKKLLQEKKIKHIFFEHHITGMQRLGIGENEATDFLENLGYTVEKKSSSNYYAFPKNNH